MLAQEVMQESGVAAAWIAQTQSSWADREWRNVKLPSQASLLPGSGLPTPSRTQAARCPQRLAAVTTSSCLSDDNLLQSTGNIRLSILVYFIILFYHTILIHTDNNDDSDDRTNLINCLVELRIATEYSLNAVSVSRPKFRDGFDKMGRFLETSSTMHQQLNNSTLKITENAVMKTKKKQSKCSKQVLNSNNYLIYIISTSAYFIIMRHLWFHCDQKSPQYNYRG